MQPAIFSPELAVMPTKNMKREIRVSSKESLDVQKCCVPVAEYIVVLINRLISTSLAAMDSTKKTLEDCGDEPMSKSRKAMEESVIVTSTNKGFRTIQHSVATYEQTKKDCLTSMQKE